MNTDLSLMCGTDIPVPELQLVFHQPTIKEIAFMGEENYFSAIQCLLVDKKNFTEDKTVLNNISNFQIFMTIMQEKTTSDKKEAVLLFCQLLFPKYKVLFTPNSMILNTTDNSLIIDETNFTILQSQIERLFGSKSKEETFNPANDKASEIAKKLMRGRQRVAEQKSGSNTSVLSQYLSILSVGLHIPIQTLIDLTVYQINNLIERYSLYIKWDLDMRVRMAGGTSIESEDWMKNIG